jgi:inward rectifier potassium channel
MATEIEARPEVAQDLNKDLGFGSVVANQSRQRFLNRDGSFNVVRDGLKPFASLSLYHSLLTMTWPRFLGLVIAFFLVTNSVFATLYSSLGPGALLSNVPPPTTWHGQWFAAFFFSVHTFATIGYGDVVPVGMGANLLVVLETLVGLLGFALATGILFARFSRPTARLLFSERAIIAPYRGITAFEFRITNARSNQLIEMRAQVQLSRLKAGGVSREFFPLKLERDKVTFFPLSWTIVHPIDETSPLWGVTEEQFLASDAEFLILLSGQDETFSQTVHARSSYKADEIVWGVKFATLFEPPRPDGTLAIDIGKLDEIERVPAESD